MLKQLFIQTVTAMVDHKTVFACTPRFWGDMYDAIKNGQVQGIDQTYITIFRTIHCVKAAERDLGLQRENEYRKERRTLLSAIEHRINGLHVTVLCRDVSEKMRAERKFEELLSCVKAGYSSGELPDDYLTHGRMTFSHLTAEIHTNLSFGPYGFRLRGMDKKDKVLLMPSLLKHLMGAYEVYQSAYEQFDDEYRLSRFVGLADQAAAEAEELKSQQRQREQIQALMNIDLKVGQIQVLPDIAPMANKED